MCTRAGRSSGPTWWARRPGDFRDAEAALAIPVEHLARALGPAHGPSVAWHDDHAHVTLWSTAHERLDLMVAEGWVVTMRGVNHAGHAWAGLRGAVGTSPGSVLAVAVRELTADLLKATRAGDQRLARLEEEIFADHLTERDDLQRELFSARRTVMVLRRSVDPFQELVEEVLRARPTWLDEDAVEGLAASEELLARCSLLLDGQRELLAGAVDAHLALLSHRMNVVVKQITAWGAVLFAATIVTGVYGMNFTHMPELGWRFGYPAAVGLVLLSMGLTVRHFRRKGWM